MITTSGITIPISPEAIVLLHEGLQQPHNHPAHDVAMRVIDELKGQAMVNLPPDQGTVFLRTVLAPIALRVADITIAKLRLQVLDLEKRCNGAARP